MAERCRFGGEIRSNGNCTTPDPIDGQPDQSVGEWSERKHERLKLYIEATRSVRAKYLPPNGNGGAAFVDLFAGPGRARVRDESSTIPGSPLLALEHTEAPFTKAILCELDTENIAALRARTGRFGRRVEIVEGDCNSRIDRVVSLVPPYGLNVALVDPFGARAFKWVTIARLGSVQRMDVLLHFPTGTVKRNFLHQGFDQTIDEMIGDQQWRKDVRAAEEVPRLINHLRRQLVGIGYEADRVNTLQVTNSQNVVLYHLVFASKDKRGTKIWKSITKHDGKQRGFGF